MAVNGMLQLHACVPTSHVAGPSLLLFMACHMSTAWGGHLQVVVTNPEVDMDVSAALTRDRMLESGITQVCGGSRPRLAHQLCMY